MANNPWEEIKLSDYTNHMGSENVYQLQALNTIIKEQVKTVCVDDKRKYIVAVLGITDGNGLEHISPLKICEVIGIDINNEYLCQCEKKYQQLKDILNLHCIDLMTDKNETAKLIENSDLIIANLIIEHVHLNNFIEIIGKLPLKSGTVSCVIQYNPDGTLVSNSGYEKAFDCLYSIIEEVNEESITDSMTKIGYCLSFKKECSLPNGKSLIRLDYSIK